MSTETIKDPAIIRKRKSYKYYSELRKELVKLNADDEDAERILEAVHKMVDKNMWYGSETVAAAAAESLKLLAIECGRECDQCHKPMNKGFVIGGGCEYYCSKKCLHKHMTEEEYLEQYDNGNGDSYWTEWE